MGGDNRTRHNREIERKFLVKWLPDNLKQSRCLVIEQGYLATESAGRQVRLRKTGRDCVADIQGRAGQSSGRTRDQAEPEAVRSALAWYGREKIAKTALRNSLGQSSDRGRYLSWQTCRSRSGRGGISRQRELSQIQSALVVWAGSDRRKTLQQRATSSDNRKRYGLPFEIARTLAGWP